MYISIFIVGFIDETTQIREIKNPPFLSFTYLKVLNTT